VKQEQGLPYSSAMHLSHITQDCKSSKPCSAGSLKCCPHLCTVPLSLFTSPLITLPTARTSDTETPALFPKLRRRRRLGRGQPRAKGKLLA